jgi:hypothetical protein
MGAAGCMWVHAAMQHGQVSAGTDARQCMTIGMLINDGSTGKHAHMRAQGDGQASQHSQPWAAYGPHSPVMLCELQFSVPNGIFAHAVLHN